MGAAGRRTTASGRQMAAVGHAHRRAGARAEARDRRTLGARRMPAVGRAGRSRAPRVEDHGRHTPVAPAGDHGRHTPAAPAEVRDRRTPVGVHDRRTPAAPAGGRDRQTPVEVHDRRTPAVRRRGAARVVVRGRTAVVLAVGRDLRTPVGARGRRRPVARHRKAARVANRGMADAPRRARLAVGWRRRARYMEACPLLVGSLPRRAVDPRARARRTRAGAVGVCRHAGTVAYLAVRRAAFCHTSANLNGLYHAIRPSLNHVVDPGRRAVI